MTKLSYIGSVDFLHVGAALAGSPDVEFIWIGLWAAPTNLKKIGAIGCLHRLTRGAKDKVSRKGLGLFFAQEDTIIGLQNRLLANRLKAINGSLTSTLTAIIPAVAYVAKRPFACPVFHLKTISSRHLRKVHLSGFAGPHALSKAAEQ